MGVSKSLEAHVSDCAAPATTMANLIMMNPQWEAVNNTFHQLAPGLVKQQLQRDAIFNIVMAPNGIVQSMVPGDLPAWQEVYGLDLLRNHTCACFNACMAHHHQHSLDLLRNHTCACFNACMAHHHQHSLDLLRNYTCACFNACLAHHHQHSCDPPSSLCVCLPKALEFPLPDTTTAIMTHTHTHTHTHNTHTQPVFFPSSQTMIKHEINHQSSTITNLKY